MKTEIKTPENIWKDYSDKQNKDYLKLYKETNRVKADTQILVYQIESELLYANNNTSKINELLKEITKINKL